jgi:ribose 5-phosphate isomerase B
MHMIFLASDHRGYELKEKIKTWLTEWGREYMDCGPNSYQPQDDYPDYVAIAAEKVAQDPVGNLGIVLGATGQGEAMVANRRRGIRAAVYYGGPADIITLSREHNAANILGVGASFVGADFKDMLKLWLDTPFSNDERHVRRIAKIDPQ